MNFILGLWLELAIITNKSNLINLNKIKKTTKNMKSISLINHNLINNTTKSMKIKELKTQILELKVEIKEFKYVS